MPHLRHLNRVYTVCHSSCNMLDISTGSKMVFFFFNFRTDMTMGYGFPIFRANMICVNAGCLSFYLSFYLLTVSQFWITRIINFFIIYSGNHVCTIFLCVWGVGGGGQGGYGPFKNISSISSRSFIEGGQKSENPGKNNLTICKLNLAFPHMTQERLEPQRLET